MDKITLLGVQISVQPARELLDYLVTALTSQKPRLLRVVTPNPEQIVLAQKDEHFKEILNRADIAIPDGWGVGWGLRVRSSKFEVRRSLHQIPGVEFMEDLVKLASEKGWQVGLLGGRNGVAQKALTQLQQKYPGLMGWAEEGPKIEVHSSSAGWGIKVQNEDEGKYFEKIGKKIRVTNTRMLFIGLGAPKQEYFADKFKVQSSKFKEINSLILMVVGGAFDEISGRIPRCPTFIQKLGFKWLWRLVLEPWRIKRQLQLVTFMRLVLLGR